MHASKGGRTAVFLETKIWISDYGYDETLHAFDKSAGKLGVDQIDLLILHQALPSDFDKTLEAYRGLETLLKDGKAAPSASALKATGQIVPSGGHGAHHRADPHVKGGARTTR